MPLFWAINALQHRAGLRSPVPRKGIKPVGLLGEERASGLLSLIALIVVACIFSFQAHIYTYHSLNMLLIFHLY